jgi:CRP/FNR family transcriptional regulator, cyclic AMP receptor protein
MDEIYQIDNVPLFASLTPSQLETLRKDAMRQLFKAGETIFNHGDTPEYLYIVEEGVVDIVLPAKGEEIILASLEAGSFFGELSVFDSHPRTATARATMDASLICIPLGSVAALTNRSPTAARQFMSVIIHRLRTADELLARVQLKNVNEIVDEQMSLGQKVADLVARFGGSWIFIISFCVFLLLWMAVNTAYVLQSPPDPYPYIFLNLILSCIAALQAPIIMMSQNRQAVKDRLQADQDFQINIKAEFAIQQIHRKLDELRAGLIHHRRTMEMEREAE